MSDLRALMRAQKSSNRIQHPYARYNNLGALSCSLCSLPLKSEVLWPSHLTSKTHRSNLKRVKEEQEKATAAAAVASSSKGLKRQAEPDADNAEDEAAKRARVDTQEERTSDDSPSFLPAGFFGNPEDASEANADDVGAADPSEPIDEEWAAFEATLQQPEEPLASTSTGYTTAATITAQPVLFEDDEQEDGNGAGQAGNEARDAEVDDHDEEPKETEEERQEREEREELMERIETEEREQQEADERVDALKKRLLAVRSSRKAGSSPVPGKAQVNGGDAANIPQSAEPSSNGMRKNRRNRW